jgi:hypothetical protein
VDKTKQEPKEKKHKYHTKIDDLIEKTLANMKVGLVQKLLSVLNKVLEKLQRYDEGTMMGGFMGMMSKKGVTGSGVDEGKKYIQFVRANMDQIDKKITDDLWALSAIGKWYAEQVQRICTWLSDRLDKPLHPYQCTCLVHLTKKLYSEFEMHGMEPDKLNSQHWQLVEQRMQTEEASCALCQGEQGGNENGNDSDDDRPQKPPQKGQKASQKGPKGPEKGQKGPEKGENKGRSEDAGR